MLVMETLQADGDATQISIFSGSLAECAVLPGSSLQPCLCRTDRGVDWVVAEVTLLHWRF
jgi:hypothetical protein